MLQFEKVGVFSTAGVSRSSKPRYDFPALIVHGKPTTSGGKRRMSINQAAEELLGLNTAEGVNTACFIYDYLADGRLFIVQVGSDLPGKPDLKFGKNLAASNAKVYNQIVEGLNWIQDTEDDQVFELSAVGQNMGDYPVAEVTVQSETSSTTEDVVDPSQEAEAEQEDAPELETADANEEGTW